MNRFPKNERLCSRKQIDALFATGESFLVYPFKVIYELRITNYELRGTGDDGQETKKIENGELKIENYNPNTGC